MKEDEIGLHLKHRPSSFEEFIGNDSAIAGLKKALKTDRVFLFHGPSGSGKTTLARIIKEELNCTDRDFYEYDAASLGGIDLARHIKESSRYAALSGEYKIFVYDECQNSSAGFYQGLLKATEDTPQHVRHIFCTTEPEKLPTALRSRCSQFALKPFSKADLKTMLTSISKQEKIKVSDGVIKKIADMVDGNARQALIVLDQVRGLDEERSFELIEDNTVEESSLQELCQSLLRGDGWKIISPIVAGLKVEPEKVRRGVLGYMEKVLLGKGGDHTANIMRLFSEPWYNTGRSGMVLTCYLASKLGRA